MSVNPDPGMRPPQYEPPMHQPQQQQPPMHQPQQLQPPQQAPMHQMQQSTTNVVVVNQQPNAEHRLVLGSVYGHRDWTSGLFGCTENVGGCIKTWCCAQCIIMELSGKLNENVCVTSFVPGSLVTIRTRLRTLGGIEGSICKDYYAISCCYFCALCQMDREITAMRL